jgi:hypothetical protein
MDEVIGKCLIELTNDFYINDTKINADDQDGYRGLMER